MAISNFFLHVVDHIYMCVIYHFGSGKPGHSFFLATVRYRLNLYGYFVNTYIYMYTIKHIHIYIYTTPKRTPFDYICLWVADKKETRNASLLDHKYDWAKPSWGVKVLWRLGTFWWCLFGRTSACWWIASVFFFVFAEKMNSL